MKYIKCEDCLKIRDGHELIEIRPWGKDSIRVRSTLNPGFSEKEKGLLPAKEGSEWVFELSENGASVTNGKIRCSVTPGGCLSFYRDDKLVLAEYYRGRDANQHSRPNELWSYGEEAERIFCKYLNIRLEMKDYLSSLMDEASENGSPVMRTMFYEFPENERCWELDDQYMLGPRFLVAPVLRAGMQRRDVYLPEGSWRSIHGGPVVTGGRTVCAETPLDIIPVFERVD